MPMFWSAKRTTIEWLAAQLRDQGGLPPDEAMRQAEENYANDPQEMTEIAGSFATYVNRMTGVKDPRRIGV